MAAAFKSQAAGLVGLECVGYGNAQDASSGRYTVYIVHVTGGPNSKWVVYRPFSSFQALHNDIKRTVHDIPPAPAKRVWATLLGKTADLLKQRRHELHVWLGRLATSPVVCGLPCFQAFFQRDPNLTPPGFCDVVRFATGGGGLGASEGGAGAESESKDVAQAQAGGRGGDLDAQCVFAGIEDDPNGRAAREKVHLKDFELIKVVGKGSFGKVLQVLKKDTGDVFALKILTKTNIIRRNQVEHTKTERSVLGKIDHPFIVGMKYAFQDPEELYFVLDYCGGGPSARARRRRHGCGVGGVGAAGVVGGVGGGGGGGGR